MFVFPALLRAERRSHRLKLGGKVCVFLPLSVPSLHITKTSLASLWAPLTQDNYLIYTKGGTCRTWRLRSFCNHPHRSLQSENVPELFRFAATQRKALGGSKELWSQSHCYATVPPFQTWVCSESQLYVLLCTFFGHLLSLMPDLRVVNKPLKIPLVHRPVQTHQLIPDHVKQNKSEISSQKHWFSDQKHSP